jgi:hypothetical protein
LKEKYFESAAFCGVRVVRTRPYMKTLALALLLSLPVPKLAPTAAMSPVIGNQQPAKKKGGQWYFAATGHAVYCYGPVKTMQGQGGLLKVATFCRGDQPIVPLKD